MNGRDHRIACRFLFAVSYSLIGAPSSQAITINISYCQEDSSPYEVNNVKGTTIVSIFEAAATYWEDYLPNSGTYNVCVSWDSDLSDDPEDNVLGSADSVTVDIDLLADPLNGGSSQNPAAWFIDLDHSEFDLARVEASSLTQGEINAYFNGSSIPPEMEIGFSGSAKDGSDAEGKFDALTVALHELGHILGVNSVSGDTWVPPVSKTGGQVVIIDNSEVDDGHIAAPTTLMFPSPSLLGNRTLPSTIDILAVAADESFADVDLPRQAFLVDQASQSDPDFSWHVGPFFWEGGALPGTDDQARITNSARVSLQTADVHIASLVVAGGSVLKTQDRTMLVDGLTDMFGFLPTQLIIGAGGMLETTDLRIAGAQINPQGGTLVVNQTVELIVAGESSAGGRIDGFGAVHVTEHLKNDGQIHATGGTLTFTTPPLFPQVWDLDGEGGGLVNAFNGNIIVQGPHHGQFHSEMTVGPGRRIVLDSPWVLGLGGQLLLTGGADAPATFQGEASEIRGDVIADKLGVLEGVSYVFAGTAMLSVPDGDDVLELRAPSLFQGNPTPDYAVEGNGTVRQLTDITVESITDIDAAVFDWGNSAGGVVNDLTVMPRSYLTVRSSTTGTPDNEYRGTIHLNNGLLNVGTDSGWTLPSDKDGEDRTLGTLLMHNNPEISTAPEVFGSDLTLGGMLQASGGDARIHSNLATRPTAEIEVQPAASLSLFGHTTYDGPLVHGGGSLYQVGDAEVVSETKIGTHIYAWDGAMASNSSSTHVASGAALTIQTTQIDVTSPATDGYDGHVTVANKAALIVLTDGPWRLDGTMTLQGVSATEPEVFVDGSDLINYGTIEGNGEIQLSIENHGTIGPGLSAGTMLFQSGFVLGADGSVEIELGGLEPGSEFDQLQVAGSAVLDGVIRVSSINGFMPTPGQEFPVLTAGNIVDNGLVLEGPLSGSLRLVVDQSSVMVEAIMSGVPGDYNNNGVVDAADYTVWRDNLGAPAGTLTNDIVRGAIGQAQYNIWKTNFGNTSTGGSLSDAAVPEPTSAWLAVMVSAAVWVRDRSRRITEFNSA